MTEFRCDYCDALQGDCGCASMGSCPEYGLEGIDIENDKAARYRHDHHMLSRTNHEGETEDYCSQCGAIYGSYYEISVGTLSHPEPTHDDTLKLLVEYLHRQESEG